MDINDLFDGIMKSIKLFADLSAYGHAQAGEIAGRRLQDKDTGVRTRSGDWGEEFGEFSAEREAGYGRIPEKGVIRAERPRAPKAT